MGYLGGHVFSRLNDEGAAWAAPSENRKPLWDQPVNLGAASLCAQRWNDRRMVFGLVPEPDWNVMFATRRWTPILSRFGLMRSWISDALVLFVTRLMTLPSSTKVTVAILVPRTRALN